MLTGGSNGEPKWDWLRQNGSWLSLGKTFSDLSVSPSSMISFWEHVLPKAYIWVPERQYPAEFPDGPPCPKGHLGCTAKEYVTRMAFGRDANAILFFRRFECKICGTTRSKTNDPGSKISTFSTLDPDVLARMPIHVQEEFAFVSTSGNGKNSIYVDRDLIEELQLMAGEFGMTFEEFHRNLAECRARKYHRTELKFLSYWQSRSCELETQPLLDGNPIERVRTVPYRQGKSFHSHLPSAQALATLFMDSGKKMEPLWDRAMSFIGGKYLKVDHSHKVTKQMVMRLV